MENGHDDLLRFVRAQEYSYETALFEIQSGRKQSHWMWYIFPQLRGLGYSPMAQEYGISGLDEAKRYLAHPVLGPRLIEICGALMQLQESNPTAVFGTPDDMKLRSCVTLFSVAEEANPVFRDVLNKYFGGQADERTLGMIGL